MDDENRKDDKDASSSKNENERSSSGKDDEYEERKRQEERADRGRKDERDSRGRKDDRDDRGRMDDRDDRGRMEERDSRGRKDDRDDRGRMDDREDRRRKDDRDRRSDGSESGDSRSVSSLNSGLNMPGAMRRGATNANTGKGNHRGERKKDGKVRHGRVKKRRRSPARRQVRRAVKRRTEAKRRSPSGASVLTRISSKDSDMAACGTCGHRCCSKRSSRRQLTVGKKERRLFVTKLVKKIKKLEKTGRLKPRDYARPSRLPRGLGTRASTRRGAEQTQVGSRCKMLSPLFINSNCSPVDEKPDDASDTRNYTEITPEMIYFSLKKLAKWKEYTVTGDILDDMMKHFPLNPDAEELYLELDDKLRIAVMAGIVRKVNRGSYDFWCLNNALQKRGLSSCHVTMFWRIYGDTMRPVSNKQRKRDRTEESGQNPSDPERRKSRRDEPWYS